ncbi:hypothetical protein K438DRAFT_2114004 [Mycena galopus ATCC 62051]|nr:hypothetical protein K438DRAFT_2114004 [Mycena galopus ATCC 62051]
MHDDIGAALWIAAGPAHRRLKEVGTACTQTQRLRWSRFCASGRHDGPPRSKLSFTFGQQRCTIGRSPLRGSRARHFTRLLHLRTQVYYARADAALGVSALLRPPALSIPILSTMVISPRKGDRIKVPILWGLVALYNNKLPPLRPRQRSPPTLQRQDVRIAIELPTNGSDADLANEGARRSCAPPFEFLWERSYLPASPAFAPATGRNSDGVRVHRFRPHPSGRERGRERMRWGRVDFAGRRKMQDGDEEGREGGRRSGSRRSFPASRERQNVASALGIPPRDDYSCHLLSSSRLTSLSPRFAFAFAAPAPTAAEKGRRHGDGEWILRRYRRRRWRMSRRREMHGGEEEGEEQRSGVHPFPDLKERPSVLQCQDAAVAFVQLVRDSRLRLCFHAHRPPPVRTVFAPVLEGGLACSNPEGDEGGNGHGEWGWDRGTRVEEAEANVRSAAAGGLAIAESGEGRTQRTPVQEGAEKREGGNMHIAKDGMNSVAVMEGRGTVQQRMRARGPTSPPGQWSRSCAYVKSCRHGISNALVQSPYKSPPSSTGAHGVDLTLPLYPGRRTRARRHFALGEEMKEGVNGHPVAIRCSISPLH